MTNTDVPHQFAIALHGGAGTELARRTPMEQDQLKQSLRQALEVGRQILAASGTALDAVEQTVRVLEEDPLFNAGRGAVLNSQGKHELDASIMDGAMTQAGAVAGVTTVKHPIALARLVMKKTRNVLLCGDGAEKFADEWPNIERVPNDYFRTEQRYAEWLAAVERAKQREEAAQSHATVGCVALDTHGNLVAGTSTGGMTNKRWGRIGDTPIIGAGTYANNATCAVSCTGTGEYFIRCSAAFHISALMEFKGFSLDAAVREIVEHVLPVETGGIIAVDRSGCISMHFNTLCMYRAATDSTGWTEIALGKSN